MNFLLLLTLIPIVLSSDVLEFKDSNFESNIASHSIILVEFYAPWCGHCKRLAPEYEIAATKLKKQDPPIPIAKVDCTAETQTCSKYEVGGYPTLKVFKGGKFAFEYGGERSADGIVKYMISKSGPSSKLLSTKEDVTKFLSSDDAVVVGFFTSENDANLNTFQSVADKLNEDMRFGYTTTDLGSEYGLKDAVGLFYPKKIHNKFEPKFLKYDKSNNVDTMREWIEGNVMGIAGHKTATTNKYFTKLPLITAYYNVDYEKDAKGTNYVRNRIMKVGKKFLDNGKQLYFAISNSKDMSHELNEFGVDSPDTNKVYIAARDERNQKFRMKDDFNMDNLEKFINQFLAGELTAYLKSEEIPASNNEPVKVVVAKNFDQIVNDPSKDVLIEFYAPWCGHCKSLAPKYDELAQKLSGESSIVIAKMDATANDVPKPYEVQGFPTLYFAPKNSKDSPRPYQGGREVDDFIKYIAAESTTPLSGFDRTGRPKKSDL